MIITEQTSVMLHPCCAAFSSRLAEAENRAVHKISGTYPLFFKSWKYSISLIYRNCGRNTLTLLARIALEWPAFCAYSVKNNNSGIRITALQNAGRMEMPVKDKPVVIKKYANRRLYNTGTSAYVTLDDLAQMVKQGKEFTVQDAKTGDDITHPVLTQIIFELENREGQSMLPISFLRQLIAFYGDQMQMIVPGFLEQSMIAFAREQDRLREQINATFAKNPIDMMQMASIQAIEEQTRKNIEMFQNAMSMFTAFPSGGSNGQPAKPAGNDTDERPDQIQEIKEQIAAMQRKIDSLG